MELTINGKKYNLAYTFNSFKYMGDFDVNDINDIKNKPFKIASVLSILFNGALNYDRKKFFSMEKSDELLEKYINEENGDMGKLLETLVDMLQETSFFKQNQ